MAISCKISTPKGAQSNQINHTTEAQFIAEVQQEISVACSLPFQIPKKEIQRIISQTAKWMYKNYEMAVEERYFMIESQVFSHKDFKCDRTIILPECIFSVYRVAQTKGNGGLSKGASFDGTQDLAIDRLLQTDVYKGGQGAFGSEALMWFVITDYWLDIADHITQHSITFDYSPLSNKLVILGETPTKSVVLQTTMKLPIEYLMNDELFFRYVVATAKRQLSRVVGTFQFNLPGNITINYDLLREEGSQELEEIKQEVKDERGADFFFTTGGW